ncbi:MAG: c-type cytochrome [Bryobacteraceae bacterium]|nr:c-type cytochrome [Bryobacteraceae bacterium]
MAVSALAAALLLGGCRRESRDLETTAADRSLIDAVVTSELRPGGVSVTPRAANPYQGNAVAVSEGKRLYSWFNCTGCHFQGGGGIGPSLMDDEWIYGGQPAQIFDTIVRGRPNGMPAWSGKIPQGDIWRIVAYVQSLSGRQPASATPVRGDELQQGGGMPAAPSPDMRKAPESR